jgi:TonB family protein
MSFVRPTPGSPLIHIRQKNQALALLVVTGSVLSVGCATEAADREIPVLRYETCAQPEYPLPAMKQEHQGTARVRAFIDATGGVSKTELTASTGSQHLDRATVAFIASCKFLPAVKDSKAVAGSVEVVYAWKLK